MKRETVLFSPLVKKIRTISHKSTLSIVISTSLALLAAVFLISTGYSDEKDREIVVLNSEISQLRDCLGCNASQIANLSAQVAVLNIKLVELERTASEKIAENEKLRQQVRDLSSAFREVEAELDGMVKAEAIYLLADRLRNPYDPTE